MSEDRMKIVGKDGIERYLVEGTKVIDIKKKKKCLDNHKSLELSTICNKCGQPAKECEE